MDDFDLVAELTFQVGTVPLRRKNQTANFTCRNPTPNLYYYTTTISQTFDGFQRTR